MTAVATITPIGAGATITDEPAAFMSAAIDAASDISMQTLARPIDPALSTPPAGSGFSAVLQLDEMTVDQGFRLTGLGPEVSFDMKLSNAGDLNGDGVDDIILGDHGSSPGGLEHAGQAYVLFGHEGHFKQTVDLTALDGTDGFRIDGETAGDFLGASVSAAGDVNGDGYGDLVIGAPGSSASGPAFTGAAYVLFGHGGSFAPTFSVAGLDGTNGFEMDGVRGVENCGYSVNGAGDFNGDGYGDFVVGAPGATLGGAQYIGVSYVVYGQAEGFPANFDLNALDGADGFRITGINAREESGAQVSSAGDVNGDGYGDIIVGAPFYKEGEPNSYAGRSYVIFGRPGEMPPNFDAGDLDGHNGFRLIGPADEFAGWAIDSAGDFNGDGYGDLVIGAVTAGETNSGASYVVFGHRGDFNADIQLSGLDGTHGFRLVDNGPHEWSGRCVSRAGDVNADGFDDILIGAPDAGHENQDADGSAYVVFGTAQGMPAEIDLASLDGANGFRIDGTDREFAGSDVSAAGDLNGDGVDDLIVGAEFASQAYVVYGQLPTEAVVRVGGAADQTIQGGKFADTLKGLGGDDLLVGHNGADRLFGGAGADTLEGGLGKDRFHIGHVADSTADAPDLILDLDRHDKINLARIDADTTQDGDQPFHLVSAFTGQAGELVVSFDGGSGLTSILGDVDGDGLADLVLYAAGDHGDFTSFAL